MGQSSNLNENIFMPMEAEIISTEQLTTSEKKFTLKLKNGSRFDYQPGQILEVSIFGFGEIPIGIASSPTRKSTFDIVVRTVGRVSTAINRMGKGQSLYVRGPLGHGFDLKDLQGHNVLIVAGGIGLCPTRSLIQYILDRRSEFKDFKLFFGAKSPKDQLFLEDLKDWRKSKDVDFHESVDRPDEAWQGNVGVITTLFNKTKITADYRVIVCGPPIMYKFVIRDLQKLGVPDKHIYLDMERRMKCGIGKCGHCQINDLYCCLDGPVFSYEKISHLEEAFS